MHWRSVAVSAQRESFIEAAATAGAKISFGVLKGADTFAALLYAPLHQRVLLLLLGFMPSSGDIDIIDQYGGAAAAAAAAAEGCGGGTRSAED